MVIFIKFVLGRFPYIWLVLASFFTILNKLYTHTTLTYNEGETTFETTSGVRQGGPKSLFLFNLYIDFVMRVFVYLAGSGPNVIRK